MDQKSTRLSIQITGQKMGHFHGRSYDFSKRFVNRTEQNYLNGIYKATQN